MGKYPPSVFFNLHRLVWSVQSRPHLVRIYWFFNEQLERDHPATFNNFPSSKSKNKKKHGRVSRGSLFDYIFASSSPKEKCSACGRIPICHANIAFFGTVTVKMTTDNLFLIFDIRLETEKIS